MSMSQTSIQQSYTDQINSLPDEAFLGSLIFFSISQADVDLQAARDELDRLGLPPEALRRNLRPIDAFRKCTADMARKFKPVDGIRSEMLARSLGEDEHQSYRQLVLERVVMQQGKKRRVFYEAVAQMTFTRGTKVNGEYVGHSIEVTSLEASLTQPLAPHEKAWLDECLAGAQAAYQHFLTHLDSHAVRSYVRDTIYDVFDGTCVKGSGGLYFARQEHAADIAKLGEWVRGVGSEYHHLPLLNLAEQRDMILTAFEEETFNEADRLIGEVGQMLRNKTPILAKTWDAYVDRAATLARRTKDYSAAMGGRADKASAQVQLLHDQVMQLADCIRESQRKAI